MRSSYPWRNATASLKLVAEQLKAALCCMLSVAKCHGLIEASLTAIHRLDQRCYPWRNATASLKLRQVGVDFRGLISLSVAKCHGLIEAGR